MNEPRLVVGDGNLGLWSALRNVFPGAAEQRCWNHRVVNVLTRVPKQRQGEARELLTKILYQRSERQARQKKRVFQNWCVGHGYERAAELIYENWEQMVTFYRFPSGHWRHLRTTNALRLRTDAAKRFKKVANATAVVWKMLLVAECRFRRINSPELLPAVAAGQPIRPAPPERKPAGASITTAYRSEEANTRRPPPDLFTHLLTEPRPDLERLYTLWVGTHAEGAAAGAASPGCRDTPYPRLPHSGASQGVTNGVGPWGSPPSGRMPRPTQVLGRRESPQGGVVTLQDEAEHTDTLSAVPRS